ncbi:hypothetical protein [Corynebacterium pacaense]|uniref:hypothetical protein n=1 Tax=Corynebacterium pacaense TaxID=1816684 RepID=UPI001177607F|nr:hypothetical protein [Corynebacterium pacaense]
MSDGDDVSGMPPDEPTSCGPILKSEVMALLQRKQKERDLRVLFFTHDVAGIRECADRIMVINEG